MSINYDASLIGVNTPSAITGVIADRPAATNVSEGTFFISTDTQEIFSAKAGAWISVSGGGGGSQNLAQVLAVGNNANGQLINLNTNLYSRIQADNNTFDFELTNDGNGPTQTGFGAQASQNALLILRAYRIDNNATDNDYFEYQTDLSKNTLELLSNYISSLGIQTNAKFECKAGVVNRLTFLYTDFINNLTSEILNRCESDASTYWKRNDGTDVTQTQVRHDRIILFKNGNSVNIDYSFISGTLAIKTPEFSGTIANVNEKIVASNMDLSLSTQNATEYGVYKITTGSNTNFLNFDNFIANSVDGMFCTLLVADTPVKCQNTLGNIIGTATINSKGLYKIMRFGSDIYSSHI